MLQAAVLGALAPVGAGRVHGEAQHVVLARDGVDLPGQLRHPERVDHVVGVEADLDRPPDRHVDLVGRLEAVVIAHRLGLVAAAMPHLTGLRSIN